MAKKFIENKQWVKFPQTIKVCAACFNSSKDFYNPILRKEANLMPGLRCPACKVKWIPISASISSEDGKWYSIRERPLKPVVRICDKFKGQPCNNVAKCEYPHNQLEILSWNEELAEEVVDEKYARLKLECFVCEMKIGTYDELKRHIDSKQHINTAISKRLKPTIGLSESCSGPIRRCPKKPNDIFLCSYDIKKTRCYRGAGCKNAHSPEELQAWKESLKYEKECKAQGKNSFVEPKKPNYGNIKLGDYLNKTSNDEQLDPAGNFEADGQDADNYRYFSNKDSSFIHKIKRTFRRGSIDNCQKPSHIVFSEEDGTPLKFSLTPNANKQKWRFRICATTSDTVKSVILYDHRKQFTISSVNKGSYANSELNKLPVHLHNENIACRIGVPINTNQYIEVVVLFTPLFGEYKMYVLYELDSDKLFAQEISGRVMEENFLSLARILKEEPPIILNQIKPHETVIWETSYKIFHFHRQNDLTASKYQLMPLIEYKIKSGVYDKLTDRFTPDSYRPRFHQLLYIEEYEHRKLMLKYDIDNCPVTSRNMVADEIRKSVFLVTFKMKCHLFEGYGKFRPPELAHVIPKGSKIAYECLPPKGKFYINYDSLTFEIRKEAISDCEKHGGSALIKFSPDLKEYAKMHAAIDMVNVPYLFPELREVNSLGNDGIGNDLLSFLKVSNLSRSQKIAIEKICDLRFASFPAIVSGAFGCGKTRTILKCAQFLVTSNTKAKVLICCHNNSCADLYIQQLDYLCILRCSIDMIRYNSLNRKVNSIAKFRTTVLNYSLKHYNEENKETTFLKPTINQLRTAKILVTTTMTLYNLIHDEENKNLFTHIFIDEAAQIIEPETCIPLVLAGNKTKVVLVGDIYQTTPVISSEIARKFDFQMSLFERLYNLPEYNNESELKACKTDLNENYRSPKEIVDFLSELFYDNKLKSHPPELWKGPHNLATMSFVHVNGREKQLANSSSFFNEAEAAQIAKEVNRFIKSGVNPNHITILTTYNGQLPILRKYLEANHVPHVLTTNLEGIQGLEMNVIIVSTVRTIRRIKSNLSIEEKLDLGLLNDEKQFNTILSRARGWVMVVGCAQTLTNVGDCSEIWVQYIRKCREYNSYYLSDFEDVEYLEATDSEGDVYDDDDDDGNSNDLIYDYSQPESIESNRNTSLMQNSSQFIPSTNNANFLDNTPLEHPQAKQIRYPNILTKEIQTHPKQEIFNAAPYINILSESTIKAECVDSNKTDIEVKQTQMEDQIETTETGKISLEKPQLQVQSKQTVSEINIQENYIQGLNQIQSNTDAKIEVQAKNFSSSTIVSPTVQLTLRQEAQKCQAIKETNVNTENIPTFNSNTDSEIQFNSNDNSITKEIAFDSSLLSIFEQQKALLALYQQACRRELLKYSNPIISFHLNQLLTIGEQQLYFINQQNSTLLQFQDAKANFLTSQHQNIPCPNIPPRSVPPK